MRSYKVDVQIKAKFVFEAESQDEAVRIAEGVLDQADHLIIVEGEDKDAPDDTLETTDFEVRYGFIEPEEED
jgi:hypothetical protein